MKDVGVKWDKGQFYLEELRHIMEDANPMDFFSYLLGNNNELN